MAWDIWAHLWEDRESLYNIYRITINSRYMVCDSLYDFRRQWSLCESKMLRAIVAQIANRSSRFKSSLGRKCYFTDRRSFSATYYQGIFNSFLIISKFRIYIKCRKVKLLTFNNFNFYQKQKFLLRIIFYLF